MVCVYPSIFQMGALTFTLEMSSGVPYAPPPGPSLTSLGKVTPVLLPSGSRADHGFPPVLGISAAPESLGSGVPILLPRVGDKSPCSNPVLLTG